MVTPSNNSYAPPKSTLADITADAGAFEKASRGTRLAAAIIDGLIFTLPIFPAGVIAGINMAHSGRSPYIGNAYGNEMIAALAAAGLTFFIGLAFEIALWIITAVLVHRNGQTIGKKWLGIKVVRTDGSRATLGRIFWLRNVVNWLPKLVPFVGKLYGLIDALFIFGEAQRCCHDYIADTIVIRA